MKSSEKNKQSNMGGCCRKGREKKEEKKCHLIRLAGKMVGAHFNPSVDSHSKKRRQWNSVRRHVHMSFIDWAFHPTVANYHVLWADVVNYADRRQ